MWTGLYSFLNVPEQNPSLRVVQLLEAARVPWLAASSSIFKDSDTGSVCFTAYHSDTGYSPSPTFKDLFDYPGLPE